MGELLGEPGEGLAAGHGVGLLPFFFCFFVVWLGSCWWWFIRVIDTEVHIYMVNG